VTKYRQKISVEDFAGVGLGWDGETPNYHSEWELSNKPGKNKEILIDYISPTERQLEFLSKHTTYSKDFIMSRTKQECISLIGNIIKSQKSQQEANLDLLAEYYDELSFIDQDHNGG